VPYTRPSSVNWNNIDMPNKSSNLAFSVYLLQERKAAIVGMKKGWQVKPYTIHVEIRRISYILEGGSQYYSRSRIQQGIYQLIHEPFLSRPLHTSPNNDSFTPRFWGGRLWRLMQAKALSWEPDHRVRPLVRPP